MIAVGDRVQLYETWRNDDGVLGRVPEFTAIVERITEGPYGIEYWVKYDECDLPFMVFEDEVGVLNGEEQKEVCES